MGILCGHWNCGRSFGLGIAEDHGNRNRNDMGVDTGKKSIFRIIRCSCVLWAEPLSGYFESYTGIIRKIWKQSWESKESKKDTNIKICSS